MNKQELLQFFKHVDQMKNPLRQYPKKTVVHFYHEQSRSIYSFKAASIRLGCKILNIKNGDESFEDTIKTIQHYGDALVLRHPEEDSFRKAISMSRIPVIQAGMHGQQAQGIIDIYTIYKELLYRGILLDSDSREVIHITFLGYNRMTSSLIEYLDFFPKIECHYVSDLKDEGTIRTDILYVSPKQNGEKYCVDKAFLSTTKATMILMHPLPRKEEISQDLDTNPRSVYFHQSENGLYVRMAILDKVFSARTYPTIREYFWIFMASLRTMLTFNLLGSFNFGT